MNKTKWMLAGLLPLLVLVSLNITAASAKSDYTDDVNFLFWFTMAGSVIVGLAVVALMVYLLVRYREGTNVERKSVKNEFKWEMAWIMLAIVLAGVLAVISTPVLLSMEYSDDTDAEEILIVARKYQWDQYHTDNNTFWKKLSQYNVSATNQPLYLEVGQRYMLNMTSEDVVHSFFVYDLSFKLDAVPGTYNTFYFTIEEAGEYTIACAEFCGEAHYAMLAKIVAS